MRTLLALLVFPWATFAQEKQFTNTLGMTLVRIEAGSFLMGSPGDAPRSREDWLKADADEFPAHKVKIAQPFYLGVHEVTNAHYEAFDPEHKSRREGDKRDNDPVAHVTWEQAVAFCAWLSKKEGKPYRLPTEAEWEYACRAGTNAAAVGNFTDLLSAVKKMSANAVGGYAANAWGLHDMHGNVAEWCSDWYGPYDAAEQADPVGRESGYARVTRGWSYQKADRAGERYARAANRSGLLPVDANKYTGFRVVQGEAPKSKPLPAVVAEYQKNVVQKTADAPRHDKPYYVNYTAQTKHPSIPKDSWGPVFSQHNHYGAICYCPNGDILFAWYTTVGEPGRELAQACSRLRAGSDRWEPASSFFDVPDMNDHAPVLFCDGKRIYHFGTQSLAGWDNSSNFMRYSDDNGATWSQPQIILNRESPQALSQPCTCILDAKGNLVLACDGDKHRDERVMLSSDRGATWKVAAGDMRLTAKRYVIHPALFQRGDGTLVSYLRGPDPMPAMVSKDRGESWQEEATSFPGIGTGQRTAALKLKSGALVVVSPDKKGVVAGGNVFAALSLDDGKTWPHVRKLDGVGGYMAITQASDGLIYVGGTKQAVVCFNEAWLKEGAPLKVSPK